MKILSVELLFILVFLMSVLFCFGPRSLELFVLVSAVAGGRASSLGTSVVLGFGAFTFLHVWHLSQDFLGEEDSWEFISSVFASIDISSLAKSDIWEMRDSYTWESEKYMSFI